MSDTSGVGYSLAQFFYDPATFAREKNLGPKQELLVKICSVGIEIFTLGIPYLIARSYLKDRVKPVSDAAPLVRDSAVRVEDVAEDSLLLTSGVRSKKEPEVVSVAKESRVHGDEIIHIGKYNADIRGLIFDRLPLEDLLKMKRVDPPVPGLDEYILNKFSAKQLVDCAEKTPPYKVALKLDPYIAKLVVARLNKFPAEINSIMIPYKYGQFIYDRLSLLLSSLGDARSGLTHLDLSCVKLSVEDLKAICKELPKIENLKFSNVFYPERKGEYLTAIKSFESLQSLQMNGCGDLKDGDLEFIASFKELRSLTLSGLDWKVTSWGLRQLKNMPNLEKLCLVRFQSLDGKVLSEIVSLPQFKSLDLVLDDSSKDFKLSEALEGTNRLENLGVVLFTPMNDSDMDAVLRQTNLRSLVIKGCSDVNESKFRELKNLSNLEVVSLKDADHFPDNVNEVLEASKVPRVYISDNKRLEIANRGRAIEFEYRTY